MTILQSLKSLTTYPIPSAALCSIAEGCGVAPDAKLSADVAATPQYQRAQARVYMYLYSAPNIAQGGISFSFSSEERKRFMALAKTILAAIGDNTSVCGTRYGYKGTDF